MFRKGLLILVIAVTGGAAILKAQALPASAVAAAATETDAGAVRLLVGRSTVLDVGSPIARVSLTSADVADAMVTSPSQLLINGKMPGTISLFVWDRGGALRRYEVSVQRDLARLQEQMKQLFPGEKIDVQSTGKNVVLTGLVTSKEVMEKAVSVAAGHTDSRDEVVTLLQLQAGAPSNQVLLRVRFAEVSRSALTELGSSFAANGYKDGRWFGRSSTQQFAAPEWDEQGRFVFSDFLNLFLFDTENQLAAVIKALQNKGLFESLAEPNLVAESGKEASFLAGGEFPIPVAQGSGANIGVSVIFKEFGIRLNFTPTVNGNRVHLKVRPEVSALDFNNSVVLQGFRIPALTTRRTETELELENGQTFAIAGLINNTMRSSMSRIPGIGHIPIIGLLFQSKAAQKENTELVVMITPEILPNNSRGVTDQLPRLQEQFLPPPNRQLEPPPPAFGAAATRPAAQAVAAPVPAGATPAIASTSPAAAAAAVSALTPAAAPRPVDPGIGPIGAVEKPRPLTEQEKKALERARREEERRAQAAAQAEARMRAEEARRLAEQQAVEQREAEKERERQEKLAREQAKRDAEEARRAEEQARKQAEIDARRQKAIAEAEAKLKAAEAAYQAEVSRQNNR